MTRQIDRLNAKFVPLGPCECPRAEGSDPPHPDGDWAKVRTKRGYGEKLELSERASASYAAAMTWFLATGIVEWNLVGVDGSPIEISEQACYDLDDQTAEQLRRAMDEKRSAKDGADPKRSGGRSRKR